MESIVRKISKGLPMFAFLLLLPVSLFCSCESAFPNDELDNFWKLTRIEYLGGTDLFGQPAQSVDANGVYFGFARTIIQIENHPRGFDVYGMFDDMGDSIRFDFTDSRIDGIHNAAYIQENLRYCGVDSLVTVFKVNSLNSTKMVLSTGKVKLNFEKW